MSSGATAGQPIWFGFVGAGPWAQYYHAPLLSTGPETRLDVVWARRREQAEGLAAEFGCRAVMSVDELLDSCEAVAFAVPPDVQARLAPLAARTGKHLLIEKPVGFTLEQGEALAEALNESGVVNMLMLKPVLRVERRVHPRSVGTGTERQRPHGK